MASSAIYYVVSFIVVFSTIVFIVLFGRLPAFKDTIVGKAHVLLWHKVPAALVSVDMVVTGGRLCAKSSAWADYLVNDKNWAVVVFYSTILTSALFVFFLDGYPRIYGPLHRLIIPPLAFQPYFYLYLTAFTDPGTVTQGNNYRMQRYFKNDNIIFYTDTLPCRTCHLPKPARSKHCSVCKRCVAKMDHHCAWVNNCLGYYNYRFFLAFIVSNLIVLTYGAYLSGHVLYDEYLLQYFPHGTAGVKYPWASLRSWILLVHSHQWTARMTSVFMIAILLCPLVIAFFSQHILYIHQGMTTNESEKWSEVQWVLKYGQLQIYRVPVSTLTAVPAEGESESSATKAEGESARIRRRDGYSDDESTQVTSGSADAASAVEATIDVHVYKYEDGTVNRLAPAGGVLVGIVPDLESVTNIYDKGGFFRNLMEVLLPPDL
ncbi:DHHC palmitoyltransferase-domain-containing protein [Limtongia smithiae]|uniref:DHHC palmitoyltransferase-domain-containing protein n=1 Tax=Limtongia smithiae TaxID=1125753 RepID=UPI0034CEBB12